MQLQWKLQVEIWMTEPKVRGCELLALGTTKGTGRCGGQETGHPKAQQEPRTQEEEKNLPYCPLIGVNQEADSSVVPWVEGDSH